MRGSRILLTVGILMAAMLSPQPGHAAGCGGLSGPLGSWQVRKMVIPGSTQLVSFRAGIDWPIQDALVDEEGYHGGIAAFLYDPKTKSMPMFYLNYVGANAPYGVVDVNGTYFNEMIPSTRFSGIQGDFYGIVNGTINQGTYYLVILSVGPSDGLIVPSEWRITINYGYDCPLVNIPATSVTYNNHDYTGGTHVYTPYAEVGKDLRIDFDVAEKDVFGMFYYSADPPDAITYTTPTGSGPVRCCVEPIVSGAGHYNVTNSLVAGANASVDVNLLKLNLP